MAKKKGKSPSFDAMVKFFLHHYHIPSKADIDQISDKLDRLEKLILAPQNSKAKGSYTRSKASTRKNTVSASDTVLEVVKRFKKGVGFADIQARTGYDDKKLRNIIFRLNKLKKITRAGRGIYIAN
jgi:hypothetical protein